jgi:chromosome segregation ATPase
MTMVSNSGADKTAAQIKALKAQQEEYEKAHKEWLKGRDIAHLESAAQARLEVAKEEAEEIIDAAKSQVLQIESDRKQAAILMAAAESDREEAASELAKAKSARAAAESEFNKASVDRNASSIELQKLLAKQAEYDKRIAGIQAALQKLITE